MTPDSAPRTIKLGYENFRPPCVPPEMYVDRESWLILPEGVRPAGKDQVAASFLLGVSLFVLTAGIGYLVWGMVLWGRGQTPAQRMMNLRCWLPETGRVADRKHMTIRELTGLLNGEMLIGPILWLMSKRLNSLGDFFAGTAVVYDPDNILADWIPSTPPALPGR